MHMTLSLSIYFTYRLRNSIRCTKSFNKYLATEKESSVEWSICTKREHNSFDKKRKTNASIRSENRFLWRKKRSQIKWNANWNGWENLIAELKNERFNHQTLIGLVSRSFLRRQKSNDSNKWMKLRPIRWWMSALTSLNSFRSEKKPNERRITV